jgi:hypothetical protein
MHQLVGGDQPLVGEMRFDRPDFGRQDRSEILHGLLIVLHRRSRAAAQKFPNSLPIMDLLF